MLSCENFEYYCNACKNSILAFISNQLLNLDKVYSYYSIKFHSQKTIRENRMKMDSAHMEMRVGSFIFRHELDATYTELNK